MMNKKTIKTYSNYVSTKINKILPYLYKSYQIIS